MLRQSRFKSEETHGMLSAREIRRESLFAFTGCGMKHNRSVVLLDVAFADGNCLVMISYPSKLYSFYMSG